MSAGQEPCVPATKVFYQVLSKVAGVDLADAAEPLGNPDLVRSVCRECGFFNVEVSHNSRACHYQEKCQSCIFAEGVLLYCMPLRCKSKKTIFSYHAKLFSCQGRSRMHKSLQRDMGRRTTPFSTLTSSRCTEKHSLAEITVDVRTASTRTWPSGLSESGMQFPYVRKIKRP